MKLRKNKKQKTDQIIRIEELEALMQKYGDDLKPEDMEDIVSMYMPHRKRRKLGAALLRLDKAAVTSINVNASCLHSLYYCIHAGEDGQLHY